MVRQRLFKSPWTPPRPPITQPSKLAAYSDEHLAYEVGMLARAAIYQPPDVPREVSEFLKSMRAEGFGLHLRNLIEFLYPNEFRPKPTSVCAHHFVASRSPYADWLRMCPELSSTLRRAKERADRELAHLTTARISGTPAIKHWDANALLPEIDRLVVLFSESAASDRLGAKARNTIAELSEVVRRYFGKKGA